MTASDILNIVVTVGLSQLACDLLAKYFVFNGDRYKRAVSSLERAQWKLNKAEVDAAKNPSKNAKRLQRAKDDYGIACNTVASKHTGPGVLTSMFFVMLLRILGAEHKGNIMALTPFVPFSVLGRITRRGLEWGSLNDESMLLESTSVSYQQGASFFFIYMLAALSVKFFVNKVAGAQAPPGADRGIMTMLETPGGKNLIKSFGIDPEELKLA